ncbi:SDR family NAD(P)-dependent oxidoreductase, partial [Arthrospira platensis SPKY1]|nr:SDR family NAD(P)-dependent oxidoreductase [Arthrospira platensis SPKY1]
MISANACSNITTNFKPIVYIYTLKQSIHILKTIVITGTSRGIGLEICRILSAQGHQILSLSRNIHPELAQWKSVTTLSVDLSDLAASAEEIKHHIAKLGGVDALIHNAGVLVNKPFEELTLADFQRVYEVNVFGVAQLTQL